MNFDEFKDQITSWIDSAKDYFSDLSNEERYGWIGEGVGVAFFLVGIVLLII